MTPQNSDYGHYWPALASSLAVFVVVLLLIAQTPNYSAADPSIPPERENFTCWNCSDSKTTCNRPYAGKCAYFGEKAEESDKYAKYHGNCTAANLTLICKAFRVKFAEDAAEVDKGCKDAAELKCFESTFSKKVPMGGCIKGIKADYNQYADFWKCVVNATGNNILYNIYPISVMREMADFYPEKMFTLEYCLCDSHFCNN